MQIYFTFVKSSEMNLYSYKKSISSRMYFMKAWNYIPQVVELLPKNCLIHIEVNIVEAE